MIHKKSVLAIIPARGGSKGLPGKNIKPLGGKPMLAWSIEAALQSKFIDRTILTSDDQAIINVAKQYGCEVPFARPAELAQDDSSTVDTIVHAIEQLPSYDIVVLLQPTCPLRDSDDIDNALTLMNDKNANSCVSVSIPDKSPYWMYTANSSGQLEPLSNPELSGKQRQELPEVYVLNGAIYIINTQHFLKTRTFVPEGTIAFVMIKEHSVDIDYQVDLDFVEFLIQRNQTT